MNKIKVYFISDGTGLSTEQLGKSILIQFPDVEFEYKTIPFVNTLKKAQLVAKRINKEPSAMVFSTLIYDELNEPFDCGDFFHINFLKQTISQIETIKKFKSVPTMGLDYRFGEAASYEERITAMDFTIASDDGHNVERYSNADIIIVGVSRTGKTPVSIYLALINGLSVANYPLVDLELESQELPNSLKRFKNKLFGLTIAPKRLQEIREKRRSTGKYASPHQVQTEIRYSESLFNKYNIPYLDTTSISVEEIATSIKTELFNDTI